MLNNYSKSNLSLQVYSEPEMLKVFFLKIRVNLLFQAFPQCKSPSNSSNSESVRDLLTVKNCFN